MLSYDTQKTWFSRLVRHLARKRSGSILTTPDPAQGIVFKGKQSIVHSGASACFIPGGTGR